jgi:dTDP-4-dehydrorhamnose reductase
MTALDPGATVLITGCGGMVGEALYRELAPHYEVVASDLVPEEPWLIDLDVTNPGAVLSRLRFHRPAAIVHLAALTDLEFCERNPEQARAVNARGATTLMAYAEEFRLPFVYISTACIFAGVKKYYGEDDVPNPRNIYGATKLEGELAARSLPTGIVIRAGWMMGGGPGKDKKFVGKVLKRIREGERRICAVKDKWGTLSYSYDMARWIRYLLETSLFGVYNCACETGASRYEIAQFMVDCLGLRREISVEPVTADHFARDYFAPRPDYEQLASTRLRAIEPCLTRDWQPCVRDYLGRFDWGVPSRGT